MFFALFFILSRMLGELLSHVDFTTAVLATGCAVCFIAWLNSGKPQNLPPSPRGLPVLGILPIFCKYKRCVL